MDNTDRYYVYEFGLIRHKIFKKLKEIKEYYENKVNENKGAMTYEVIDTEAQAKNSPPFILSLTDEQFKEFIKNL
jgi:broad-specificity NMP kinase